MTMRRRRVDGDASGSAIQKDICGERLTARRGDVLTVIYNSAKIAIGNYSNVDVDGATLVRELLEGEDVGEQFDKLYGFLKERCEGEAREKIVFYASEVAKGRRQ